MGSSSRSDISRRRETESRDVFIRVGMEVRQPLELTPGEGGVNADSRLDSKLKLLTPPSAVSALENPVFATGASANSPANGYRRTWKRRGSRSALAVENTQIYHDRPVKGRPEALCQAADIFFSCAARRETLREPVFL